MSTIDTIEEMIKECRDCPEDIDTRKTAIEIYALVAKDVIETEKTADKFKRKITNIIDI